MSVTNEFNAQVIRELARQTQVRGRAEVCSALSLSDSRLSALLCGESRVSVNLVANMHASGWLDDVLICEGSARLGMIFVPPDVDQPVVRQADNAVEIYGETPTGQPVHLALSPRMVKALLATMNT